MPSKKLLIKKHVLLARQKLGLSLNLVLQLKYALLRYLY